MQQEKLIVLEFRTLPQLEQVRSNREKTFALRLMQLQGDDNSANCEGDSRENRRNRGGKLPVY